MTTISRPRWHAIAAAVGVTLAASAVTFGAIGSSAQAATDHVATASVDTTYLQDALGLPTNTIVEPVTYDRFQWLLQQSGQFAFLIGTASDAGFKAKAVAADAAARAAGASKVYWFDPNLTGFTGIRNLDTRNPGGINLVAASQTVYGNLWKNILGQYLGNGFKAVANSAATNVTVTIDDTVVNDIANPLWDYRSTATAAVTTTDDVFFIYDKDNTSSGVADKVVSWVNLSTTGDAPTAVASTFAAAGGGSVVDQLSQFEWWKSSANRKHDLAYTDDARYGGDILEDADAAAGWRVKQITYPELLHLLDKNQAGANFVLLFGGTWCHNTRAVIKQLNHEAQANGVATVYNFDWVLDGGTINGTNGSGNQLHVRDARNSGSTNNFRPSYVYGDVVSTYFPNVVTEYVPTSNGVSYYPGGDLSSTFQTVRKGQVPFLLHYERGTGVTPSSTAVKRQWIQTNVNATTGAVSYKEYMTEWWFTLPSAQLGLNFVIPTDETTLTTAQKSQLSTARANRAFGLEGITKLTEFFGSLPARWAASPVVSAPPVTYGASSTVTLTVPTTHGFEPSGSAALAIDGNTYTTAVTGNTAVFTVPGLVAGAHPYTVTFSGDPNILDFQVSDSATVNKADVTGVSGAVANVPTTSAAGTYDVTITTPSGLATATGDVTLTLTKGASSQQVTGSLSGGEATVTVPSLAAGVWDVAIAWAGDSNYAAAYATGGSITVARPSAESGVDSPSVVYGETATVTLTVPTTDGHTPSGTATLAINGSSSSVAVTGNSTVFNVPGLGVGAYPYTVTYSGDANILDFELTDSVVVNKATVTGVSGSVVTLPTTTAGGSYKATIATPSGLAIATGNVTVTLTKGAYSYAVVSALSASEGTIAVPNLAAGTWTVQVTYAGDSNYASATGPGTAVTVANPPAANPPAANPPAASPVVTNTPSPKPKPKPAAAHAAAPVADSTAVSDEEDPTPTATPSPTPTETAESAEPEVTATPSEEPEPSAEATEDVQASAPTESAEGFSTGILVLGGLLGLSLLGYVGLQLFQRRSIRP